MIVIYFQIKQKSINQALRNDLKAQEYYVYIKKESFKMLKSNINTIIRNIWPSATFFHNSIRSFSNELEKNKKI